MPGPAPGCLCQPCSLIDQLQFGKQTWVLQSQTAGTGASATDEPFGRKIDSWAPALPLQRGELAPNLSSCKRQWVRGSDLPKEPQPRLTAPETAALPEPSPSHPAAITSGSLPGEEGGDGGSCPPACHAGADGPPQGSGAGQAAVREL